MAERGIAGQIARCFRNRVFRSRIILAKDGLEKAEIAAKEVLSLPIPTMNPEEAGMVADLMRQGLNEN